MWDALHGRGPAELGSPGGHMDTLAARGHQQKPQRDGELFHICCCYCCCCCCCFSYLYDQLNDHHNELNGGDEDLINGDYGFCFSPINFDYSFSLRFKVWLVTKTFHLRALINLLMFHVCSAGMYGFVEGGVHFLVIFLFSCSIFCI